MNLGKRTEKANRKDHGSICTLRPECIPHKARRVLYSTSLAGSGYYSYHNSRLCGRLPDLQKQSKLVKKEWAE